MPDVMHSREQCTAFWTKGVLSACSWLVMFISSSCTFDPSATGEARTRGTRADESVSSSISADDTEASRVLADRLRSARAGESGGAAGAAGGAGSSGGEDRGRASEAAEAARSDAGVSGAPAAAGSGGGAGAVTEPSPLTPSDEPVLPAADGGRQAPDETDAGDDSDAGVAPIAGSGGAGAAGSPPPTAAGAGAGEAGIGGDGGESSAGRGRPGEGGRGSSAGRGNPGEGGRGSSEGGAGAAGGANRDRELLLSLLEISVAVLQNDPNAQPGELLATLGAATSADPALLASVLGFVRGAQNCEPRRDACERVCEVVAGRCRECTANADCREALRSTCGSPSTECQ